MKEDLWDRIGYKTDQGVFWSAKTKQTRIVQGVGEPGTPVYDRTHEVEKHARLGWVALYNRLTNAAGAT